VAMGGWTADGTLAAAEHGEDDSGRVPPPLHLAPPARSHRQSPPAAEPFTERPACCRQQQQQQQRHETQAPPSRVAAPLEVPAEEPGAFGALEAAEAGSEEEAAAGARAGSEEEVAAGARAGSPGLAATGAWEEEVGAFDSVESIPPSAEEERGGFGDFGGAAPLADAMGMAPYRAARLEEEEVGAFDSVAGDMYELHGATAWPDAYTSRRAGSEEAAAGARAGSPGFGAWEAAASWRHAAAAVRAVEPADRVRYTAA
jgi:hypothetical protein